MKISLLPMVKRSGCRHGFTLIELLVVIAIIAIKWNNASIAINAISAINLL